MIKIKKTKSRPQILNRQRQDNLVIETTSIKSEYSKTPIAYDNGTKKLEFPTTYGDSRIKEKLIKNQHSKCAFCESTIPSTSHGDVEHFRPKGAWMQNKKGGLKYPGYYWLAYDCTNLMFACQKCNQSFKKNNFPVRRPENRARNHTEHYKLNKEKPFLINPLTEDPRNLIKFEEAVAKGIDKNHRGKKTIEILGLNRKEKNGISSLYEERLQHFEIAKQIDFLSGLNTSPQVSQENIDEAIAKMDYFRSKRGKFSSMIRDNFQLLKLI